MKRRLPLLATLVLLGLALPIGIEAALAWAPQPGVEIHKDGSGLGRVTSVPAGIDCGKACFHPYSGGTRVTLTATPAAGSSFTGWDACAGTDTCTVTAAMHGAGMFPTSVTATFTVEKCVVPAVRRKPLAAAEHSIKSRSCSVGKITHAASQKVKKGRVISQKPKPSTQLRLGARVNLDVSKG